MLLVTGITGHTGRFFLQELIKNKYKGPICCIVRETSDVSLIDNCSLDIEKVIGSLDDYQFIRQVMTGVNTIIHIAGIHSTLNIVKAAVLSGVQRAILVHTTGIYSKFKTASEDYKKIESEIENITKYRNEISVTILRPTMIFGDLCDLNISKFIKLIDRMRVFPVVNNGGSLIQPVNARDLGKAYYQVLNVPLGNSRREYILSGDKPITMLDTFVLISKYLGKKTIFISCSLRIGVFLARIIKLISINRIDYVERVQRMGENRSYPHEEAAKDFNYSPGSFEEGIRNEVEQYKKYKKGLSKL